VVTELSKGDRRKIDELTPGTDLYLGVQISAPGLTFDIGCFGLDVDDKLSDENYFIFFNQPKSPEESIQLLGAQSGDTESFRITLDRIPAKIQKLVITATVDGQGTMAQVPSGYVRLVAGGAEVARYAFTGSEFTTERAVMLVEIYKKTVWRLSALGQGFAGGLDALIQNFGGEVAAEAPQQAAPQPGGPAPGFAPPPGGAPAAPAPAQAPGFAAPAGVPPQQMPPQQAPPQQMPQQAPQQGYPQQQPGVPQQPAAQQAAPAAVPGSAFATAAPAASQQPTPQGVQAALQQYNEVNTGARWTPQNKKLMKVTLGHGRGQDVYALKGSMVAYQGDIDFKHKGAGGFAQRVINNLTGQELELMKCSGRGDVFLAENAADLHVVELNGTAGIRCSANSVLAFDETIQTEVQRIDGHGIPGGGLFVMHFTGQGSIILKTHGVPVVLPVTPTTFADANAIIAWSDASQVVTSTQVRLRRTAYPGHSGETVNLQFRGAPGNFIVVQPYEV
jgi:stress response protein SCP2/uncharacterized protein (AIM24 family)